MSNKTNTKTCQDSPSLENQDQDQESRWTLTRCWFYFYAMFTVFKLKFEFLIKFDKSWDLILELDLLYAHALILNYINSRQEKSSKGLQRYYCKPVLSDQSCLTCLTSLSWVFQHNSWVELHRSPFHLVIKENLSQILQKNVVRATIITFILINFERLCGTLQRHRVL